MPTYEYACHACNLRFEKDQRITEDAATKCDLCGGAPVERLISRSSFALKGSGWYSDLYSSPKATAADGKGADAKPVDGKAAEAKPAATESKPAESKPAESKPAEAPKPAAEAKPAAPKSETKAA